MGERRKAKGDGGRIEIARATSVRGLWRAATQAQAGIPVLLKGNGGLVAGGDFLRRQRLNGVKRLTAQRNSMRIRWADGL